MPGRLAGVDRTPDYRRLIDIVPEPGRVVADMQDFCHHFRVVIDHADGVVTRAEGIGVRVPWTTCPLGAAGVAALAGTALGPMAPPPALTDDRTGQCTHMIDLAAVAIAHATGDPVHYDVLVTPSLGPQRTATLRRNGEVVLEWQLQRDEVASPGPLQGMQLRGRELRDWVESRTDPDEHELAAVMRRACQIAPSRAIDLDDYQVAAQIGLIDSSCHTLQPSVAPTARRVKGSSRPTETVQQQR
jgi:hypothetical protein